MDKDRCEDMGNPERDLSKWTHWDLKPGPPASQADVILVHHVANRLGGHPSWPRLILEEDVPISFLSGSGRIQWQVFLKEVLLGRTRAR